MPSIKNSLSAMRVAASTAVLFLATFVEAGGVQTNAAANSRLAETVLHNQQEKILNLPMTADGTLKETFYPMLNDELVNALGSAPSSHGVPSVSNNHYYPPIIYPTKLTEEEAFWLFPDKFYAARWPSRTRLAVAAKRSFAFSRESPFSGLIYAPARG